VGGKGGRDGGGGGNLEGVSGRERGGVMTWEEREQRGELGCWTECKTVSL